jgi:hypothetical protein
VKFRAEHEFPGSVLGVADILSDPDFHTALELPDLSRPEVVEHTVADARRILRLRYEFVGHLDPIARRLLAGRRLTWIQELQLDTVSGAGRLSFAAEAEADRLYGQATVMLVALGEQRTRRTVAGDLFVKVPMVGGTAERRIVPGLVARLDVEAAALTAALTAAG